MTRKRKTWERPSGCRCVSQKVHENDDGYWCAANRRLSKVQSIDLAAEIAGEVSRAIAAAAKPVGEATWHGGAYLTVETPVGTFELRVKRLRRSS